MLAAAGLGQYPDLHSCAESFVKRRALALSDGAKYIFYENKFKRYCDRFKN
jgi:hypothetical protein